MKCMREVPWRNGKWQWSQILMVARPYWPHIGRTAPAQPNPTQANPTHQHHFTSSHVFPTYDFICQAAAMEVASATVSRRPLTVAATSLARIREAFTPADARASCATDKEVTRTTALKRRQCYSN